MNFLINIYQTKSILQLYFFQMGGCASDQGQNAAYLKSNNHYSDFQKDIAEYDRNIDKVTAIIVVLERYLMRKPQGQKKKTMISQLAHANLLLKKFNQTRKFLIKQQLNISTNRQNMKVLEIIKKSNQNYKNSQQLLEEAGKQSDQYKVNMENMGQLGDIVKETMKTNPDDADFEKQMAKLEAIYT